MDDKSFTDGIVYRTESQALKEHLRQDYVLDGFLKALLRTRPCLRLHRVFVA